MAPTLRQLCGSSAKESRKQEEELLNIGDIAPDFELVGSDGKKYKLSSFRGRRVLLSFFRFASCPVCMYSIDRMKQQTEMLKRADIVTICIFRSTPDNIQKFASAHISNGNDSVALGDKKGSVYASFQVRQSAKAILLNGNMHVFKNYKRYKSYINMRNVVADNANSGGGSGGEKQLPADFLIDEHGVIVDLLRSEKVDQFIPFERVEAFIPKNKRCKCNKRDCISARCRKEYEEIKIQSEAMLYTG